MPERDEQLSEPPNRELPLGVKLVRTLRGHKGVVSSIAFDPEGLTLASASRDRTVKLWEARSGRLLRTLRGHENSVMSVAFDPTGRVLASGSEDKTIRLWDTHGVREPRTLRGHKGVVMSVAFDRGGATLASGSEDKSIRLWDVETGNSLGMLRGHEERVVSLAYAPSGRVLASGSDDKTVKLWDASGGGPMRTLEGHENSVLSVTFDPAGRVLASGSLDLTVKLWDVESGRLLRTLEGHTHYVDAVAFSADGRFLASNSCDGTTRLWNCETWEMLAVIPEPIHPNWISSLAFHPASPLLATVGSALSAPKRELSKLIHLWELAPEVLPGNLSKAQSMKAVHHTTAKIVLVGDSGVGKTGLGWRLAHGEFKEHSSTHGEQFWVVNELGKTLPNGTECEAVLWDLAGQPDYRLIHTLFLDDVDLALVLFDPSNRQEPLKGVEYWLRALPKQKSSTCHTILIGARSDRGTPTLTRDEIREFCDLYGISGGCIFTSAMTGEGVPELQERINSQLRWELMSATTTTLTFKRIKEYVLALKEKRSWRGILVSPKELLAHLKKAHPAWKFSESEMMTAVGLLENHGYLKVLSRLSGEVSILLAPDLLNDLASSFVLEARRNPMGLGSLQESRLLRGEYSFPEVGGLSEAEKDLLFDGVINLFIKHNICFRQTVGGETFLIFPALINQKRPLLQDVETFDDTSYMVKGPVENVYASLVVLMGYTNTFKRTNSWQNQAQYEVHSGEVCGFRQSTEREGEAEFVLYYGKGVSPHTKLLFRGLFETFLNAGNLDVSVYEPVVCPACEYRQERSSVVKRMREGKSYIYCDECGNRVPLPTPDARHALAPARSNRLETEERMARRRTEFEALITYVKGMINDRLSQGPPARCFISYASGDLAVSAWVENRLAADLSNVGIEVMFDRLGRGAEHPQGTLDERDFVLLVATPGYKGQLEKKVEEYRDARGSFPHASPEGDEGGAPGQIIPLLFAGDPAASIPAPAQGIRYADFRDESQYFKNVFDLILMLYGLRFDAQAIMSLRGSLTGHHGIQGWFRLLP